MKFFIKPKSHRVIQTVRLDGDKWVAQEKIWDRLDIILEQWDDYILED